MAKTYFLRRLWLISNSLNTKTLQFSKFKVVVFTLDKKEILFVNSKHFVGPQKIYQVKIGLQFFDKWCLKVLSLRSLQWSRKCQIHAIERTLMLRIKFLSVSRAKACAFKDYFCCLHYQEFWLFFKLFLGPWKIELKF